MLNEKISFTQGQISVRYGNPFPIENELKRLFDGSPNISLTLVSDVSREELEFGLFTGEKDAPNHLIPEPTPFSVNLDDVCMKPMEIPSNNFFLRMFATSSQKQADENSDYTRCFVTYCDEHLRRNEFIMPKLFMTCMLGNQLSGAKNSYDIDWKDQTKSKKQFILMKNNEVNPKLLVEQ